MHPLKDYSTLTDDQLFEKLRNAHQYRAMQSQLGHTVTVDSIDAVIFALEAERERRYSLPKAQTGLKKNKKQTTEQDRKDGPITFGKLDSEM